MAKKGKAAGQRKLTMRFAPQAVTHLGLHTYTRPVHSIAELIANAWDADASKVELEIPFGQDWSHDSEIVVCDDGIGMNFDDCDDKFLVIGRDRREEGKFTDKNRPVMGHKGLGKLGCFGIAKVIEIRTVKDGRLTHFRMDFDEMPKQRGASPPPDYHPEVLVDSESTDEPTGTTITMKRLQLSRKINEASFRDSMARRFAVFSAEFEVLVNGVALTKEELDYEFRFPDHDWNVEDIPGLGTIRWWAGFTRKPVKYHHAKGMAIMTRRRLAQEPFLFNIAGGFWGQAAKEYLVGEVEADMLDEEEDLIATGRSTILWEHEKAQLLLQWGQDKVKALCGLWLEGRIEKREDRLDKATNYLRLIEDYPRRERKELNTFVRKVITVPGIEDDRLQDLVLSVVHAYGDTVVVNLIREINAAEHPDEFTKLIADWNVVVAIRVYQTVKGKLAIIDRLAEMIAARAREVPELQGFLKDNPWLLDPKWEVLEHEKNLDNVLAEHLGVSAEEREEGRLRLDFFCLVTPGLWVVVEVKRPGKPIPREEIDKFAQYVDYLREHASKSNEPHMDVSVMGKLIASEYAAGTQRLIDRLRKDAMYIITWEQLLLDAKKNHADLFRIIKDRAPKEDPRIQALETIELEVEPAGS